MACRRHTKKSWLIDIAPEVRLMVYKHLFRSTPVTIHAPGATHRESNRSYSSNGGERYHKPRRGINRNCCQEPYEMARHKCISLLLVSKGVSSEATPIFLSETPFIMDACRLLNNLKYTPRYVPRIQHLVLASGSLSFMHMTAVARNRFAACVPLQSLTVQNSSFVPRQKRGIETNPVMALTWLDIPLELRLITYRLFFECRSSYPITGIQDKRVECFMDDVYTPDTNQTSHLLNIMLACKQVHAEIKALLHQEATLLVEYSSLCSAREASSLRDLNTFGNLLFTSIYPRRFASFERALCRQLDGRRALQTLRLEVHKYVSGPLNKANLDTILRLGKVSSHKLQFSMAPAAFMTDHEIFRGPIPRICEVTVDRNGGVTIRGLIRMYTDDVKDQLMAADGVLEGTKIMVMTSYPKSRSSKTFVKAESVASGG